MVKKIIPLLFLLFSCGKESEIRNLEIYFEEGRFGGWPANYGIWTWGDEILVGFSKGYYKDLGPDRHHIDRERPEKHLFARSLNGGESWQFEDPSDQGVHMARGEALHGIEPNYPNLTDPKVLDEKINFKHPDLVLTFRMLDINIGPSLFYYSYDRGKNWNGPFKLEIDGLTKIMARTDYIIIDENKCFAYLTLSKNNDKEGRPFCAVTTDGGITWNFRSFIGPEPSGFGIMPSTVKLSDKDFITTIRRREGPKRWIDAYISSDTCKNWELMMPPVNDLGEGNPPSLIKLDDGRLCLTYGYRAEPFKIAANFSSDNGMSWSDEVVLRDDGGGRDIGYVRSVQREDGKVVTIYYFHDKIRPERYIAATIWNPSDFM